MADNGVSDAGSTGALPQVVHAHGNAPKALLHMRNSSTESARPAFRPKLPPDQ